MSTATAATSAVVPPQSSISASSGGRGNKLGMLIAFEGVARTGKTTQAERLARTLRGSRGSGVPPAAVEVMSFPDYSTPVGKLLLVNHTAATALSKQALHLLSAANRWEMANTLSLLLEHGVTVILENYSAGSVAHSVAQGGLDMDWCLGCERGLPQPDVVIHLYFTGDDKRSRSSSEGGPSWWHAGQQHQKAAAEEETKPPQQRRYLQTARAEVAYMQLASLQEQQRQQQQREKLPAAPLPPWWYHINASQSEDEVADEVLRAVIQAAG